MKKIILSLIFVLSIFLLIGCDSSNNNNSKTETEEGPLVEITVGKNGNWRVDGEDTGVSSELDGYDEDTKFYAVVFLVDDELYHIETVVKSGYATEPKNPKKSGKLFSGWYLDGDKFDCYSTKIKQHTILEAKFVKSKGSAKLGMGIVVNLGQTSNSIQVTSTVAAVVTDESGKILTCRLDRLIYRAQISGEGILTMPEQVLSNVELKEKYGLGSSPYAYDNNGDGKVLEWYEQAQVFEEYVVGKTADEVATLDLYTLENGYQISKDEDLLSAGCTIQVVEFIEAIVKACKDDQAVVFELNKEYTLGLAILAENDGSSKSADEYSNGVANLYSSYACTVVSGEKIVAAINDKIQPKANFNNYGNIMSTTYKNTARELKEDYAMVKYGSNIDNNQDGIVKEWYQQSAIFSNYIVGMTGEDVLNMEIRLINGYKISDDEELLNAGCTIQITSFQQVVYNACNNAR